MKKFAKILGFLGFFVTLATAQIGTAWAAPDRVECPAGKYLPAEGPGVEITGPESCVECEGVIEINGVREGVYCRGGVFFAPYNEVKGRELCANGKCIPTGNHWTLTDAGAQSALECKDECSKRCITPAQPDPNCPWPYGCEYGSASVEGTIMCNQSCVAEPTAPNYYCPISCPDTCEGRCKCPLDNSTSGDCPGYDTSVSFSGVWLCGATSCDVSQNIYGNPTQNNGYCPSTDTCIVDCVPGDCPQGAYCEWDYGSHSQNGNWYQNGGNKICVDQHGNEIIPETCDMLSIKCKEACEYWDEDEKRCVAYQSSTTYKCGVNSSITASGAPAICGQSYTVNRAADGETLILDPSTQNCAPTGQTFAGWWKLNTSYTPYNNREYMDGQETTWGAATNENMTFIAMWDSSCYEIVFDDETHGGGSNINGGPIFPNKLYKRFKDDQHTWYTDEKCETKITISDLNAAMAQHLPSKTNATFDGYFYENETPNLQIFDDVTNNGALTSTGTNWMIDEDTVIVNGTVRLFAQYTCIAGYYSHHNQCVGNAIDVKYTCYSPVDPEVSTSYTYDNAAVYGTDYEVESVENVASAPNSTACQFTGYQLVNNNYQWLLEQYSSHPYGPGDTMDDWLYLSPQPPTLTEIEFTLKGDAWTPKKYQLEYRCGTIEGTPVPGNATSDEVSYNGNYTVANSSIYEQPFLDNCDETLNGNVSGYTVQNWTLRCTVNNTPNTIVYIISGQDYVNTGHDIEHWLYDYNDCYFTANWAQTDFVIHLESNISDGNNNSINSSPTDLYTRWRDGVYVDPDMAPEHTMNPSSPNQNSVTTPKKFVTVTFDGDDGTFEWGDNPQATTGTDDRIELSFKGFFEDDDPQHEGEQYKYIYDNGYITQRGWDTGISYQDDEEWHAHWGNGSVTLPWPVTPQTGYTFVGWNCNDTLYSAAQSITISGDTTCTAEFKPACYEVTFDDTTHGAPNVTVANNLARYVKYGADTLLDRWYIDSDCFIPWYDGENMPSVNRPTKENATFNGYYDEGISPEVQVFGSNGILTLSGQDWTTDDNVVLYAQYVCVSPYHPMPDGSCGSCDSNEYWNPNANNGAGACESCRTVTGGNFPYSTPPFNWSVDQCYNYCGEAPNTNEQSCETDTSVVDLYDDCTFEKIRVDGEESSTKQIEFKGNADNNVTACDGTVRYCAYGFAGCGTPNAVMKPMSVQVDFKKTNNDIIGTRYIFGSRSGGGNIDVNPSTAKIWSQIVGPGQKDVVESHPTFGTYYYTHIIYPTYLAPETAPSTGYEFTGYYYPATDGDQYVDSDLALGATNASGVLNSQEGNFNTTRNLYANYELYDMILSYSCNCPSGVNCGNAPESQTVQYNVNYIPAINTCVYTGHTFEGWMTSSSNVIVPDLPNGEFSPRPWPYTESQLFKAKWSGVQTPSINYEKIPVDDVNTGGPTENGNTYVPAEDGTPTQFTCGDGNTNITGHPYLLDPNGTQIGEVTEWCDNEGLTNNCEATKELPNSDCSEKTVYAKWECTDPRYHLNGNKDDCVACPDHTFWNGSDCIAETECPDGYTNAHTPYNWSINQCYRFCETKTCEYADDIPFAIGTVNFLDPSNNPGSKQIAFYGNEIPGDPDRFNVCNDDSIKYCPRVLIGSGLGSSPLKPRESLVTFMKNDNISPAGTRYIVGNRSSANYDMFTDATKIWSHVVGLGQQGQSTNSSDPHIYTLIIYPTNMAPNPDGTNTIDPAFKGYFTTTTGGTRYVTEALGLDSSNSTSNNAVAFQQSSLSLNQIGDRILYPQYCANGETWNGQSCTGNAYTVKYICGAYGTVVNGMSMQNTATYGQSYKVAYNGEQIIAQCQANEGYVLKTDGDRRPEWKLNNTDGGAQYVGYTGGTMSSWNYTEFDSANTPTFTAQYDCARGYTWNPEHTACVSISDIACPAELSENSHANMIGEPTINDDGKCVYTIKCDLCQTSGLYGCYTHDPISNGQFTQLGAPYDANALDGVSCTPAKFKVALNPNGGNPGLTSLLWETYGEGWSKTENGGPISSLVLDLSDLPTWADSSKIFNGYNELQNGSGSPMISPTRLVTASSTALEDNTQTWYAQWAEAGSVTITFSCNDGSGITDVVTPVYPPQDISVPGTSLCPRDGYTFTQWEENPATNNLEPISASVGQYNWTHDFGATFVPNWTENKYDVKYVCNDEVVATDRATYDQTYTVLNHDSLTGCTAPDGKVFVGWGFSNNGTTPYVEDYDDGEEFTWQYTVQQPTFTAIWDDGCYAITFNNTRFGQWNSVSAPSKFYKKGQDWYADTSRRCDGSEINPLISVLPQKDNATFIGYDTDGESADASSNLVFNNIGSLTDYGQTWPTTDDTTLYAKYDCDDGYTLNGTTCVLDSSNFHTITLDENAGEFYGVASDPNVLYTIEGTPQAYTDEEHNDPFDRLNENGFPRKYAKVTFHYCNGTNNSCTNPLTPNEIKDADFIFNGFYATTPANGQKYINSEGDMLPAGNNAAAAITTDTRWYADWNGYGTLEASRWPNASAYAPNGYAFVGWYTAANCGGTPVTSSYQFTTPDTDLYACWSQNTFTVRYDCGEGTGGSQPDNIHPTTGSMYFVLPNGTANGGVVTCNLDGQGFAGWKFSQNTGVNPYNAGDTITWLAGYGNETLTAQYRRCETNEVLVNGVCYPKCEDKTCTEPTPQNSLSHCPTNHSPAYPHSNVTCSYSYETITNGYNNGDGYCRYSTAGSGHNVGDIINEGTCTENVVCNDSNYIWNPDPAVWACEWDPNIQLTVTFKCDVNDNITTYNVTVGGTINVPAVSTCAQTGSSFTNWKDAEHNNDLLEAGTSVTWNHEYNATYTPDRTQNIYHAHLNPYSYGQSNQSGTFGDAGVENLWERYGDNWYENYDNGSLTDVISYLNAEQLPTRTGGYSFAGYKTMGGDPRLNYADNRWNLMPPTTITGYEEWYAQWTQCTPGQYYLNGCVDCPSSHPNSDPATATSIYDCYQSCSKCEDTGCPTFGGAVCTYTNPGNLNNGGIYYGTTTCELLPGNTIPNCPYTVISCADGYLVNSTQTACEPMTFSVQYSCGDHGSFLSYNNYNTATYGTDYKVAYNIQNQEIQCSPYTGYLLSRDATHDNKPVWKLNYGNEAGYTGQVFPWQYIFPYGTNPTYTAQYICDTANGYNQTPNGTCIKCPSNQYWNGSQCADCGVGQHPNATGDGCEYDKYNVTYACGEGTGAGYTQQNGATYNSYYNVLQYSDGNINCTAPTNKRFDKWLLNTNPATPYYGGTGFYWTYTIPYPTFTAQYVDCGTGYHTSNDGTGCEANHYDVKYVCNNGTGHTYVDTNPGATYNVEYYVLMHDGTPNCTAPQNKTFNGWTLNTNPETNVNEGTYIRPWQHTMSNPTFTANWIDNNTLCPDTLDNGSHATMTVTYNTDTNKCEYLVTCDSCITSNRNTYVYGCYLNDYANTNTGQFTVYGDPNSYSALDGVVCTPATYTAVYRCGVGTPTSPYYDTEHTITYNESYTVLDNMLQCQSDSGQFNGWAFNGEHYDVNYVFNHWRYYTIENPTFVAEYGECPSGYILVNNSVVHGECKKKCPVNCTWPGYPDSNPNAAPCPAGYPQNATCHYDTTSNPGIGYRPTEYSPLCLDPDTGGDPTAQTCDVDLNYDPTCPAHYHWNNVTQDCDPDIYTVALNPCGGVAGSVTKLWEKWNTAWSKDGTQFSTYVTLEGDEKPHWNDNSMVFDGYWTSCSGGNQRIDANGNVIVPANIVEGDGLTWYAHWKTNTSKYTVTFKCSIGGSIIGTPQQVAVGENLTVPATTSCPGVPFNRWKGTIIEPTVSLSAGSQPTLEPWRYYSNETFIPDSNELYRVDLTANGGTFTSNEYVHLWDAVNVGWFKDAGLTPPAIPYIPRSGLPTRQGFNFNGFKDSITGETRGYFNGTDGWNLPPTTALHDDETWIAQWGECAAGQYYQDEQCKNCPSGYTSDPSWAQSQTDCYKVCHDCVEPAMPNGEGITGYTCDHSSQLYNGYLFYSPITPNPNSCVSETNNPIQCTGCCVTCASGYETTDCNSCLKKGFKIDLKSHRKTDLEGRLTGHDVDPDLLYIWSGMGVYWYSNYTTQIKPDGTNPVNIPDTYAVVRFNPNGEGVTFTLDNYTYSDQPGDRNVSFSFRGFYNSEDGASQYIRDNGRITNNGESTAITTDTDLIWHAQWDSNNIGTLPQPIRQGYHFDGWYDAIVDGHPVNANTPVYQSMNVYAHWSKEKYSVNLNENGGVRGPNFVDKLWELYGFGWSTEENGAFERELVLGESERPSYVDNSKVFNGYWTSKISGSGEQRIRANGSVIDTSATILTEDGKTWYAQYVNNTGTFKITFRCGANEDPLDGYTQYVQNNGTVRVPAKSECQNEGRSFTRWNGNQGTSFNAGDDEYTTTWSGVFANEDFVPNWNNGDVYHVTLYQTGATEPGDVENLYEKYGTGWGFSAIGPWSNSVTLSGDDLPTKTGHDFAGFKLRGTNYTRGNFENGVWEPSSNMEIASDEAWEPKWTRCKSYWYYDNNLKVCVACPDPYTNNAHPESLVDCYDGRCTRDCVKRQNECPSDPNAIEFEYSNDVYDGTNYYGERCVLDIWVQQGTQQEVIPSCECTIKTCKPGYHLVEGACVALVKTYINLNPNNYVDDVQQGNPSTPATIYTIEDTGVYLDSDRTMPMDYDNNPLDTKPSKYALVTLDANGGSVDWGNNGTARIEFTFQGFNASSSPSYGYMQLYIVPRDNGYAYITDEGSDSGLSVGMGYTTPHTWYAQWNPQTVELPTPTRTGYTFTGWYNVDTGVRVPSSVTVNTNLNLVARWERDPGVYVTYNCDSDGGQGGNGQDFANPVYYGDPYTVLQNGDVVTCSKPANIATGTRYHEFEDWQFRGNFVNYRPGYVFEHWTFTVDNPTFNANYKECPNGSYFDGSCKACPPEYNYSDIDANSENKCYKNCGVPCIESCPLASQPGSGVAGCIYPEPRPTSTGVEYYGSTCNAVAENCPIIGYYCLEGYEPTVNGCEPISERYEITLDSNGGTGGQEKLYTIYNIGVYLDQARTLRMTSYQNYVTNVPEKTATATFNYCDYNGANCDGNPTTSSASVDLGLKGYYQTATNNVRYLKPVPNINVLKLSITDDGDRDGKGYQDNTHTWYAQWSPAAVGSLPAPGNHTAQCKTYAFNNWWTEPEGGNRVYSYTEISEDVTWYAHWCESCLASIPNGSCTETDCKATIACNNGYDWDESECKCVLSPNTRFTLTYKPNGGTPTQPRTQSLALNQTFTTLGGDTFTKSGAVLCRWVDELGATTNTFTDGVAELSTEYIYLNENDITLKAYWVACQCTPGTGVQGCSFSVVNNACVPSVNCMPGYEPNELPTCTGECNTSCDTSTSCQQCPAGTYSSNGLECLQCPEGSTSPAGATSIEDCHGNTIIIDWDENGGDPVANSQCTYGQLFTLTNAPGHSTPAAEFQGWKLFNGDNDHLMQAGAQVMCTYDNVGVYQGTSTAIQAQWKPCECGPTLDPNLRSCEPALDSNGRCWYINQCNSGYYLDPVTAFSAQAVCLPYNYKAKYNCNGGTGTAPADDTVPFNTEYSVKANLADNGCSKTGYNFSGWLFDGDGDLHQAGDHITWIYTSDKNFTAQYTNIQCAEDEILIGNDCVKCNCTIGTGATNTSCGTLSTGSNTCDWTHPVACLTGFVDPAWSCTGTGSTSCTASCTECTNGKVEVDGVCVPCQCTPDALTGAVSCGTMSISDNMCNWGPATCSLGYGYPNIVCEGSSNQNCTARCTICTAGTYGPNGLECLQCPEGYTSPAGSTSIEDCYGNGNPYVITYRPNGGVNPQTGNNQPVRQSVTYWDEFTTLVGTTFTQNNHIITRWDLYGDDTSTFDKHQDPDTNQYYAGLNEYYEHYNTLGNTIFDAHWEQCTCDADNCTTYATDENKCACSATCPTGYTYGGCNCNGTSCAPTCNAKESDAIYVCGDGATGTPPAKQTMKYGATHTVQSPFPPQGNCSKTNYTFMNWAFTGDGDFHRAGDEIVWNYETDQRFTGQWCENCGDVVNGSCELGTVFAGSCQYTCSCEPGYKLVGECNAHPECKPDNTLVIHYESNNGLNQTYNQSVTYGQPFVTEGGTRFTKVNNIMTQWKVKDDVTTTTFPAGIAGLSGDYVYVDTTDTTLEAQWEQCTCNADGCDTYATDENKCACSATCPTGYTYGGCECNGTNCAPICTLGGSNANYVCGTGIGTGYSTYVNYGDTHTILTNAFVGCYRDNSTFAGWAFNGDNTIYFDNVGATVTWNYTAPKEFEAKWCDNCSVIEHGTNQLTIPEPGLCSCVLTCDTGYHVNSSTHTCEPNVYPNGITYKPNGGTPNQNYTQTVTYDAAFTTLDWSAEHYRKPRHIMTQWAVESGGAGTFDSGYAKLGWKYPYYKTDGATVLAADWTECAADRISLDNQCQQCQCTENEGVTSCTTSATNNDTCSCTGDCAAGYEKGECNCNGITCTQSCSKCAYDQVSVNGHCTDCECSKGNNGAGIISGCGFVSNNGNICNWDPTTCELGYGYPDLTCTETDHHNNCTASCTICEAGYYGPNGRECLPCPDGYTSLPGATSIKECFISGCPEGQHIEHGNCVADERACSIPNATSAARVWNPAIGTYGPCTVIECDAANGYHESGNACVRDTCTVAHGSAESEQVGPSSWECFVTKCDPGYEPSSDSKSCVECANRYVDGDLAVSSYVSECEIAACMYQGQKYALEEQFGEKVCVPICTMDRFTREDPNNPTGTIQWDERTKKCIRTCKPGYKMW